MPAEHCGALFNDPWGRYSSSSGEKISARQSVNSHIEYGDFSARV
jgi:hypothetical protein